MCGIKKTSNDESEKEIITNFRPCKISNNIIKILPEPTYKGDVVTPLAAVLCSCALGFAIIKMFIETTSAYAK